MHGDLVLVDEDAAGRDGRRSGRIARVLTRRNTTVVGIFHYARGWPTRNAWGRGADRDSFAVLSGNYVQPWDDRVGGPIDIPPGAERVNLDDQARHRTLGKEISRGQRKDRSTPEEEAPSLEGLAVEVESTAFPPPGRPAQGRVIEVLGPPDAFGVDVEIIIRKHAIPHTFPAHVLAEAEERAHHSVASIPAEELAQRENFRGLPIVTIDGETAKDFDDAVHVRMLENGNTELQVHRGPLWTPRPACGGRAYTSRIVPCPCCRMRFRAGCARCCLRKTGSFSVASWRSTTTAKCWATAWRKA